MAGSYIDYSALKQQIDNAPTPAEGCKNAVSMFREGLKSGKIDITKVSIKSLALALGAVDVFDMEGSIREAFSTTKSWAKQTEARLFSESAGASVTTNALKVVTSELLAAELLKGYDSVPSIAERLVTTMPISGVREQKIAGFTSIGEPSLVEENHPYPHTGFTDKYVLTKADKYGSMLSLSMEAIMFDQTGDLQRRARMIGERTREHRERIIIEAVCGARSCYYPSGVDTTLYSGANFNLIGSSGVTGYTSAVALADWTDLDTVRVMRATKILDDRTDGGTPQPIGGVNTGEQILLVPEALRGTAMTIFDQTMGRVLTNSGNNIAEFSRNPMAAYLSDVLSSPFVDSATGTATTWFYGNPKRQFVWAEVYGPKVWVQGEDSEEAFENDTVFRVKSGYFGAPVATDTFFFTKVLGA